MSYEVELKFPLADHDGIRSSLEQLRATPGEPVEQTDLYFAHPLRDFAATDEAFRLRSIGEENRITYKGPVVDPHAKTRREIELQFEPGEDARAALGEMLTILGFREVRSVAKTRQPWHLEWEGRTLELALDEVEGLGRFVEIETITEEADRDAARDSLLRLAAQLGLHNPERRSYLCLLLAKEA